MSKRRRTVSQDGGTIRGYGVLRMGLTAPRRDASITGCRFLYTREHRVSAKDTDTDTDGDLSDGNKRSKKRKGKGKGKGKGGDSVLFVANLSEEFVVEDVRAIFGEAGEITEVTFGNLKASSQQAGNLAGNDLLFGGLGTRFARVQFSSKKALQRAVNLRETDHILKVEQDFSSPADGSSVGASRGLRKYLNEYEAARPTSSSLQESVNSFMQAFDQKEEEDRAAKERAKAAAADDGFTLVTRKNAARISKIVESETGRRPSGRKRKKKGSKELKNFYRFQIREQKRDEVARLREQFAKDKEKIAELKAANQFKLA